MTDLPPIRLHREPGASVATGSTSVRFAPGAPDWVPVPLALPDGVAALTVRYDYPRVKVPAGRAGNACDLGVLDPERFRGWSGGARTGFTLAGDTATPGYLPGPLPAGTWQLLLAPYQVSAGGFEARIEVEARFGPTAPTPAPAYPAESVPGRGPGWYRGDGHLHSVYSDGRRTPAEIAALARAAGLDWIISTEHNTPAAHPVWGPLAGDDLLIMVGEEVTTRNGHLLAAGIDPGTWIDWRFRARDHAIGATVQRIRDHGGLAVAAHPHSPIVAGRWKFGWDPVDLIEVWNGVWTLDDEAALESWDAQLVRPDGRWRPAVGDSDAHSDPDVVGLPQTVVWAEALSRPAVLAGLAAGRCWIADAAEVAVGLTATDGERTAGIGERLAVGPTDPVTVRAEVACVPDGVLRLITDEGEALAQRLGPDGTATVAWRTSAAVSSYVRLEVRRPRADGEVGPGTLETRELPYGPMAALTNPVFLDPR